MFFRVFFGFPASRDPVRSVRSWSGRVKVGPDGQKLGRNRGFSVGIRHFWVGIRVFRSGIGSESVFFGRIRDS